MDWIHYGKPPRFFGHVFYQVWLDDGSLRSVRRVKGDSLRITPGEFVYTDANSPFAQAICDLGRVVAWRPNV